MDKLSRPKRPRQVTRQELHDLVWQCPVQIAATKFGLSDQGLRKICRRLDVQTPPRDFWAKRAAGRKCLAPKLKKAQPGTPESVPILRAGSGSGPRKNEEGGAEPAEPPIVVPQPDELKHPSVLAAREYLATQKPNRDGYVGCRRRGVLAIHTTVPLVERALVVWEALLIAADERGWECASSSWGRQPRKSLRQWSNPSRRSNEPIRVRRSNSWRGLASLSCRSR